MISPSAVTRLTGVALIGLTGPCRDVGVAPGVGDFLSVVPAELIG